MLMIRPVSLCGTSEQTIRPAMWRHFKMLKVLQLHHSCAPTSAAWHGLERFRVGDRKRLFRKLVGLGRALPVPGELICRTGARIGRSRRSIPLLVLHTPLGTLRACRAAEAMSPFDCSRDPVRHPSRVPAVQASASAILNFDSRLLSLVNSPILLVERRR